MVLFRQIFAELIRIIFFLTKQLLVLIDNLSRYQFFSETTIGEFTKKVYIIIGVLMLFKLVISAVQYLVNPEQLSDKNKGLSSILTKSLIAVGLLVLVPEIFHYARELQTTIVEQIPSIIFTDEEFDMRTAGDDISMTVAIGFFQETDSRNNPSREKSKVKTVEQIPELVLEGCTISIWPPSNIGKYITQEGCVFNQLYLLTIPVGVYLVFLLLSMAIDIGIRTIKFGIVQILAPIPIVSYISDEKKFNNWVKTSVKIYVDLFIRLGMILFVLCLINVVIGDAFGSSGYPQELIKNGQAPTTIEVVFVKIAIIIALLLFAKNAPKFISDLLGLDADESIGNMFKRAGGMFGAAGAGLTTGFYNYKNRMDAARKGWNDKTSFGQKMKDRMKAMGSAAAGQGSALYRGTSSALKGKGLKESFNTAHKGAIQARVNRDMDRAAGIHGVSGAWERAQARARDFGGLVTGVSLMEAKSKAMSEIASAEKGMLDRASVFMDKRGTEFNVSADNTVIGTKLRKLVTTYVSSQGATMTTDPSGRIVISGIANTDTRNRLEKIMNKEDVSLAQLQTLAEINAGSSQQDKDLAKFLSASGDFMSNLKKEVTQQMFKGGLAKMGGGIVDNSNSAASDFDTQFAGLRDTFINSLIKNADSLSDLEESVAVETGIKRDPNKETLAQYLTKAYEAQTRKFESAIDAANAKIASAATANQSESAVRESIRRRDANKDKK